MNRVYRLVYNRTLGVWQVASELVKAAKGGRSSGTGLSTAALHPMSFGLWLLMGWVGLVQPVTAQQAPTAQAGRIVADPGAPDRQRPTVVTSANGTPQVNITTPSAAGVSRNTYSQFDVGSDGAILNNSRGNVQTQLGGWVQGNPWLAKGTARVILNEVNSANPSQLRGYVEVAGDRAQVVIANPAGISVDGGGFLNASRVTLTTGTAIVNAGVLDGYRVDGGAVRISGAGLDATDSDYTDIISRSLEVNAGIWAQQLHASLGSNVVSADHSQVNAKTASGNAPVFALDVGALGGMYANKIWLVGNEHGVGMRNAGKIGAQAGELVVTAEGRLENSGSLQSQQDTKLSAAGGVANRGTVSAAREAIISTAADLDNSGGTLNARRIEVNADALRNQGGAIEQVGAQQLNLSAGTLSNRNDGRIGVVEAATSGGGTGGSTGGGSEGGNGGGTVGGGGPAPGEGGGGTGGTVTPPVTPLAAGALNIGNTLNNDGGRIDALGAVDIRARAGLDNSGGKLGVATLQLEGGDLRNIGGNLAVHDADLRAATVDNSQGQLNVAGSFKLSADALMNRGGSIAHGGVDAGIWTVAGALDNSGGTLASNASTLRLNAASLANEKGTISHAGTQGLWLTTGNVAGQGGSIVSSGMITLAAGAVDHRNATLNATQIALDAAAFDNRAGTVVATGSQANVLNVQTTLDNSEGTLASNGDLTITAAELGNAGGTVQHAGEGTLAINAVQLSGHGGSLVSNGSLNIAGQTTDLRDGNTSAQRIAIKTGELITAGGQMAATSTDALNLQVQNRLDNTGGTIGSNGAVALSAANFINNQGKLIAAGNAASSIRIAQSLENRGGTVSSNGALQIDAGQLHNVGGSVVVAEGADLRVKVDALLDNSGGGRLAAGGDMRLEAARLDNRSGSIEHAGEGELRVEVAELLGAGGSIVGNGSLTLEGDAVDLQGATTQARKLKLKANALTTADGTLVSTGSDALQLQVRDGLNNDGGVIAANGGLELSAGALSNREGKLSSAGTSASNIEVAGQLDNTSGNISSNADMLDLSAGSLVNTQGVISHAGAQGLQLSTGRLDGQKGTIATGGALTLTAGVVDHRAATLNANQLTLNAVDFDNRGGTVVMTGDQSNTLDVQGVLDNGDGGTLASNSDLTIRAASFGNAAGTVQHAGTGTLAITAATLAGQAGSLLSNGSLNISGQVTDLRDGTTSAQRINVQTGDLTTAGGQLVSTGADALLLQVRNRLDNSGGSIGSNGAVDLRAATFLNNQGKLQGAGAAASAIAVAGAMENRGGIVVTAGDADVHAASLDNRGGSLHVAGTSTLELTVDGLLDNREKGMVSSGGDAVVAAGGLNNNQGTVAAGQALALTVQTGIDNSGGIVQAGTDLQLTSSGLSNAGGTVLGGKAAIDTRGQLLDNNGGTIASLEAGLTINSGMLQNNAGLIQSAAALVVDTAGNALLNLNSGSAGIVSAGTLDIRSGALDNRNGVVFAQANAQLDASSIDNSQGGSLVSAADLAVRTQSLANAGGVAKAGNNATLNVQNTLDNQAGLVAANGTLVLNAGSVDNRSTAVADQALGLQAGTMQLTTQSLDNRQGQVIADGNATLTLTAGLNNAGGQVSTGNRLDISADTVLNTAGTLVSGGDQSLAARNLSGDGKVLAQGDATLVLGESFTNTGELVANGALSLTTAGDVNNHGKIQGGAVAVRAANISNAVEGEISSLGLTQLSADGKVVNRGLIDGGTTHIVVDTLENTGSGRIYGDHVAIQARELLNRAETLAGVATSATIAARDRLDLGAGHLINSDQSLIYSGGDAAIGQVLDVNRLATGTAQQVDNISSIIEVGGNLDINALAVNNIRQNVVVEQVKTVNAPVRLDQPSWFKNGSNGNSDYKTTSNYVAHEIYYLSPDDILEDTPYITPDGYVVRRAVLRVNAQTTAYLFGRGGLYGARGGRSRLVMSDGTVTIYYTGRQDGQANPDLVTTGADDPFRELIPSEPGAPAFRYEEDNLTYSSNYGTCTTNCVQLTALYQYTDPDHMLIEMRRDPNNTSGNEQYRIATHSIVEDVVSSAGADATINAGGNMRIDTDALLNQYGRIAAGGNLDIVGINRDTASVQNIGLSLYRTHSFNNTSYTYRGASSSWKNSDISEKVGELGGVLSAGGTLSVDVGDLSNLNNGRDAPNVQDGAGLANLNAQGPGAGAVGPGAGQVQGPGVVKGQVVADANANGPDAAQAGNASTVNTQGTTGLGGTTAVRAIGDGADTIVTTAIDGKAPTGSLFKVDANRGQHLVETDPRFADYRNWLSSDHLLAQMGFDPVTTQKRLGDGFYEQKLVREQIGELTGRRFLDGYASDEDQYRALLEAGATVASGWGLRPGIALTAEQMAQLTSDIVWLVEQTITLADGSTTTALVPQVYLRVQPGDLANNGALLAGANVDLKLRGDFVNEGDVAGRKLVSIDAGNIRNLAGANISGQQVGLQAKQNIDIIGSKVTATDALSVKAGGDITVASTTRSWESGGTHAQSSTSIDRVAGLYVTSPSGIGALTVNAGGDVTLTGAQVVNAGTNGATVLAAGGNLNLDTIAQKQSLDFTADSRNYLRTSQTTHVGSTVSGAGNVVLQAGNDVNLTAANVSAGNAMAVQAGRDINSSVAVDVSTFDTGYAGKKSSRAVSASDETVQGTQITAGGDIAMQAGRDVTLQATTVASDDGGIGVSAGRDVNLTAAQEEHDLTIDEQRKKKGFLKTKTTTTHDEWHDSIAVTTTLSGETVTVAAGRDLTSQGAQIAGTGDVVLAAGRDLTLGTAESTSTEVHDKTVTKSGLFGSGGIGFTVGKQRTDRLIPPG
ncbi:filamentous hemagglutinin N-terminal domain-containing protein [Stenotrophomonas terrae]|uniref:two-partner secretion domain-containing protein n=1 Tax=Stenotrophomonas terrae TaxID=405446 RepID=UPI003208F751